MPKRICVIDDDVDFATFLTQYLAAKNIPAISYFSAEEFLAQAVVADFDFFVIDLGLPGLDGVDLLSIIRAQNQAGILVVSGRLGPDAFICALSAGADMVLNKPVRFDQVHHAILSISRRLPASAAPTDLRLHWRVMDEGSTLVSPANKLISLTPLEARLIARLRQGGTLPVTREELADASGIGGDTSQRNLDAVVFRLRRKIEQKTKGPSPVRTAHGVGYVLAEAITEVPGA